MITDSIITIWHYSEDSERYIKAYYVASVYEAKKITRAKNGMSADNVIKIRIPIRCDIPVNTGDYLRVGKAAESEPERGVDYKITEISENFKGSNPHIRIQAQ